MPKKYLTKRVRAKRAYIIDEVAQLFGITRRTVQRWVLQGMSPLDPNTKPLLFMGDVVQKFVKKFVDSGHFKMADNQFYCLHCKKPTELEDGSEVYRETGKIIRSSGISQVIRTGICRTCGGKVARLYQSLPKRLNDCGT